MKKRRITYDPLPYQRRFHESTKPKVYLSTGYGGGKTYALIMKILQLMSINRGLRGGLVVPSYKMYKRDVRPTLEEICEENMIRYDENKSDFRFYFPDFNFTLWVLSADDPTSLKGPNMAFMGINEVTLISEAAFKATISRIRLKKAKQRQLVISGTPESFNWCYEYFVESPRDDTDLIFGDMRDNTHISEDYAAMLMESYDSIMVEQYVEGKFVSLKGNRAVYAFDRMKHVRKDIEKVIWKDTRSGFEEPAPVWVTMDFNLNPMSAVLWNRMGVRDRYVLQAYDEICLKNSNTWEMCKALKERLSPDDYITIYPDPAGKSGSTKSMGKSDIDILRQNGFNNIKYKRSIKSVRDCINACNNLFDKNKIVISHKCKNFIADLEQCVMKDGINELDKSNPMRTHWLDGFKNMADYEFPIVKSYSTARQQRFR